MSRTSPSTNKGAEIARRKVAQRRETGECIRCGAPRKARGLHKANLSTCDGCTDYNRDYRDRTGRSRSVRHLWCKQCASPFEQRGNGPDRKYCTHCRPSRNK